MMVKRLINNVQPLVVVKWILRIGVFLTFFGHGYLAIHKNKHWYSYLETVGVSGSSIDYAMAIIGVLDLIVAFTTLIKPNKYILLWASLWAFSAALIRPISGEPIWAFIERGSNWAIPLALYYLVFLYKKE